jgi:hypothetical protein
MRIARVLAPLAIAAALGMPPTSAHASCADDFSHNMGFDNTYQISVDPNRYVSGGAIYYGNAIDDGVGLAFFAGGVALSTATAAPGATVTFVNCVV